MTPNLSFDFKAIRFKKANESVQKRVAFKVGKMPFALVKMGEFQKCNFQ